MLSSTDCLQAIDKMPDSTSICRMSVDGEGLEFQVAGEFTWGADEVLYDPQGVLSNVPWREQGFAVIPTFDGAESQSLVEGTTRLIEGIFDQLGFFYPADFRLERYHEVVFDDARHQKVIERTRYLTNAEFPVAMTKIAERIAQAIGRPLSIHNPALDEMGYSGGIVILRISRPKSLDINPPHRDGYLDIWKHTLNCWIPVAGCDRNSSLPLIPGSHRWNEQDICRTAAKGAKINGLTYTVPAILDTKRGLAMTRPNPKVGEVLIFTPFLIHGSALNMNGDATRLSFELRLFDLQAYGSSGLERS
jgi:hypothetical protein